MAVPYLLEKRIASVKRSLNWLPRRFYRDDHPDPANAIFISGAGRSGTTWLMEVLNAANDCRILYEPFNCEHVRLCRHFSARQYLRVDNDDPSYREPASAIFSGKVRDPWIDQYNRCRNADRRLIKDVRSTLMLKWLRNQFPQTPIIFIIRHPCAVSLSRLDFGWPTDLRERVFLQQADLVADHLRALMPQLAWADDPFERHVVDWCIENYVPLVQLHSGDAYIAFYEDLILQPAQEFAKLYNFLKRPFDDAMLERRHRRSASSRRRRGNLRIRRTRDDLAYGWRQHVSTSQIETTKRITSIFGLDQIYDEKFSPDPGRLQTLLSGTGAYA